MNNKQIIESVEKLNLDCIKKLTFTLLYMYQSKKLFFTLYDQKEFVKLFCLPVEYYTWVKDNFNDEFDKEQFNKLVAFDCDRYITKDLDLFNQLLEQVDSLETWELLKICEDYVKNNNTDVDNI